MGSGSLLALVARHSLLRRISSRNCPRAGSHDHLQLDLHAHQYTDHQKQQRLELFESLQDDGECGQVHVQQTSCGQPALLLSFHVGLAERLQHLQLQGSGSAHLNWLLDALASTLSTHSSLQSALSSTAASPHEAQHTHRAHQRADELLISLLDVCSALKRVADDVERQLRTLQQALHSVGQALATVQPAADHHTVPLSGAGRIRAAARRLSACLNDVRPESLLCVTSKQYRPLAEARASLLLAAKALELPLTNASSDPAVTLLSQAMDGTMLTSLLMLASAVSSVAAPSPRKSSAAAAPMAAPCKAITKYLGAKRGALAPWAAPLRQLQRDLRQEETGSALFQELTTLHAAAANIHAAITNPDIHPIHDLAVVRQRLDCLCKGSREAQACISTLRMHMASLFHALIALRLTLLES